MQAAAAAAAAEAAALAYEAQAAEAGGGSRSGGALGKKGFKKPRINAARSMDPEEAESALPSPRPTFSRCPFCLGLRPPHHLVSSADLLNAPSHPAGKVSLGKNWPALCCRTMAHLLCMRLKLLDGTKCSNAQGGHCILESSSRCTTVLHCSNT